MIPEWKLNMMAVRIFSEYIADADKVIDKAKLIPLLSNRQRDFYIFIENCSQIGIIKLRGDFYVLFPLWCNQRWNKY